MSATILRLKFRTEDSRLKFNTVLLGILLFIHNEENDHGEFY